MKGKIEGAIDRLKNIVGEEWVISKREYMESYLRDETPDALRPLSLIHI